MNLTIALGLGIVAIIIRIVGWRDDAREREEALRDGPQGTPLPRNDNDEQSWIDDGAPTDPGAS